MDTLRCPLGPGLSVCLYVTTETDDSIPANQPVALHHHCRIPPGDRAEGAPTGTQGSNCSLMQSQHCLSWHWVSARFVVRGSTPSPPPPPFHSHDPHPHPHPSTSTGVCKHQWGSHHPTVFPRHTFSLIIDVEGVILESLYYVLPSGWPECIPVNPNCLPKWLHFLRKIRLSAKFTRGTLWSVSW